MRHLAIWRLATIVLLATVPIAAPTLAGFALAAYADNGNGNEGNEGHGNRGDSDDGNRGHGNDSDGHDEDNPGNSSGPGSGRDDDEESGHEGKAVETIPVASYVVAVDCHPTEDGAATTCDIVATVPEGSKDVSFVQIPAEALCAEVVETEAEFVDPDPNTHVTGYKSRGSEGALTLTLDGQVMTASTATFWIKTGDGIFPVEGPGLRCDLAADAAATTDTTVTVEFEVTPAATEAPSTGNVAIAVLTCSGVPAAAADLDWFGECPPGADQPHDFALAPSDGSAEPLTATTDATGEATFADVAPGDYRLDLVDSSWCHAVSDSVTADSDVVVEAGATSTVWIFTCDGQAGSQAPHGRSDLGVH